MLQFNNGILTVHNQKLQLSYPRTATDSSHNAGRRTDDMRQESEIFTTTFF